VAPWLKYKTDTSSVWLHWLDVAVTNCSCLMYEQVDQGFPHQPDYQRPTAPWWFRCEAKGTEHYKEQGEYDGEHASLCAVCTNLMHNNVNDNHVVSQLWHVQFRPYAKKFSTWTLWKTLTQNFQNKWYLSQHSLQRQDAAYSQLLCVSCHGNISYDMLIVHISTFSFLRVASCCAYYYNLWGCWQLQQYFLILFITFSYSLHVSAPMGHLQVEYILVNS
jgi:hypothetical protein